MARAGIYERSKLSGVSTVIRKVRVSSRASFSVVAHSTAAITALSRGLLRSIWLLAFDLGGKAASWRIWDYVIPTSQTLRQSMIERCSTRAIKAVDRT